jgi:hypothetical protein
MTIDFEEDGYVIINMKVYVQKILDEIPFEMKGKATTPAASYLFDINDNCPKLTEYESQFFHYMVAKYLLFLCKRGRPDIQTPIAFLSTRVREPDGDDLKKFPGTQKELHILASFPLQFRAP